MQVEGVTLEGMGGVGSNSILRDGKGFLLAYDQGFEHGPTDFNEENVDPNFILDIAKKSGVFTGIVFQEGIAEKYYGKDVQQETFNNQLPLVLKLNGKTGFHKGEEPLSLQLTSVDRAIELGSAGVGYTIYVGSEHEETMMKEFRGICDEAHKKGIVVVAWMYPRGRHVEGKENSRDVVAYASRLALELGADFAKLPYTGDSESFEWVVKSAGKTKVLMQGGTRKDDGLLLEEVTGSMKAGATGMAVGRNVWQSGEPVNVAKKIAEIIWS